MLLIKILEQILDTKTQLSLITKRKKIVRIFREVMKKIKQISGQSAIKKKFHHCVNRLNSSVKSLQKSQFRCQPGFFVEYRHLFCDLKIEQISKEMQIMKKKKYDACESKIQQYMIEASEKQYEVGKDDKQGHLEKHLYEKYNKEDRLVLQTKFKVQQFQYKQMYKNKQISEQKLFNPKRPSQSNLFIEGSFLNNAYSQNKIIPLSDFKKANLEFNICAALNEDRSVDLIWGLKEENNEVKGCEIQEAKETFNHYSQSISNALTRVFNHHFGLNKEKEMKEIYFRLIPVFNTDNNVYNKKYNLSVICLHIQSKSKFLNYVRIDRKGFHKLCHAVVFSNNEAIELKGQKFYKAIHLKYRGKRKQWKLNANKIPQQLEHHYKHTSMMLVGSQKQQSQLYRFKKQLEQRKIKFSMCKPYPQHRKKSGRVIWLISHEDRFQILDQIRTSNPNEQGRISFFTTDLNLCIKQQIKQKDQQVIEKLEKVLLTQIEEEKFQWETCENKKGQEDKIKHFLRFQSIQASVFSFIFLENEGIRTQFVKHSHIDKLKKIPFH